MEAALPKPRWHDMRVGLLIYWEAGLVAAWNFTCVRYGRSCCTVLLNEAFDLAFGEALANQGYLLGEPWSHWMCF